MNTWNNYDDVDPKKGGAGTGQGDMGTPGQSGNPGEMPENTGNPSRKADEQMWR